MNVLQIKKGGHMCSFLNGLMNWFFTKVKQVINDTRLMSLCARQQSKTNQKYHAALNFIYGPVDFDIQSVIYQI